MIETLVATKCDCREVPIDGKGELLGGMESRANVLCKITLLR